MFHIHIKVSLYYLKITISLHSVHSDSLLRISKDKSRIQCNTQASQEIRKIPSPVRKQFPLICSKIRTKYAQNTHAYFLQSIYAKNAAKYAKYALKYAIAYFDAYLRKQIRKIRKKYANLRIYAPKNMQYATNNP